MCKALIVLAEGFEEIETVTPIDILRRAGITLLVTGLSNNIVKGSRGVNIVTETTLDKAPNDFDACILPGGMPGAENLSRSEALRSRVLNMHAHGKVIAAICAAPALVLAPWGILKGKKATCFEGMEELFDSSVNFEKKDVVVDGNVITSRGAGTALDFSLALVESLKDKTTADTIARKTLYRT